MADAGARAGRMRAFLDEEAREKGFVSLAVARPDSVSRAGKRLREAILAGHHGTMGWMAETADRRADPRTLWPDVRSVVVFAMNYGPDHDPLDDLENRDRAVISVYARNRDYHDVMKGRLKEIAQRFSARFDEEVKVFVDTAPVMEKPLAAASGTGWQGKHTNLVSRDHGSWLFLGEIFTTAELEPDTPEADHCGSCHACLDICPTNAFPAPYRLDARRCISYLTIEHKGPIPHEFREAIGNRIHGCDDCLAVCPWNKFAGAAAEPKLKARDDLKAPRILELLQLDEASFRTLFAGSPVKRIGRDRFVRNVLIAAGNSNSPKLSQSVEALLNDPVPIVRGAAVWAASRLIPRAGFAKLYERHMHGEANSDVRAEWQRAAGGKGGPQAGEVE